MDSFAIYQVWQEDDMPKHDGGIYLFKLRFPNSYEFGVGSDIKTNVVIENIKATVVRFSNAMKNIKVDCKHHDVKKAEHLRAIYNIKIESSNSIPANLLSVLIETLNENSKNLKSLIKIFEMAFRISPPLYVGIAHKQSLAERFNQHKTGQSSDLRERLKILQIKWTDVEFHCMPIEISIKKKHIMCMEKVIQSVFKPDCCLS